MLLLIAAAPIETALLRAQLQITAHFDTPCGQVLSGSLRGQSVLLAHSGVGQTAMSLRLTQLLTSQTVSAVLLCGCGGSYPHSNMKIGDLALAREECFADLGVATETGFIPLEQLDIPQDETLAPLFQQRIPLNPTLCALARRQLPQAQCGSFVTVNCCSGHPALSDELEKRSGGICESMEGAAAALVCQTLGIPLLELRGISNPTGTRDPAQWDIKAGAETAQQGLLQLLEHWPAEELPCDS